jgi:hypothetical protein
LDEIVSAEKAAAATLVPVGKKQGLNETIARNGKWTTEEEVKLKGALKKHNGADWTAISVLV